jgi:hypothetical protein
VVLTAYDHNAEERRRLSGDVETIIKKGGDTREALLHQLRKFLDDFTPRAMIKQEGEQKDASGYLSKE